MQHKLTRVTGPDTYAGGQHMYLHYTRVTPEVEWEYQERIIAPSLRAAQQLLCIRQEQAVEWEDPC